MIQSERLLATFLDLARISSPSGQEAQVAALMTRRLIALGLSVEQDEAGNVLGRLDGPGEPLMLTAHMDTVVPCDRVQPVVRDGVIYSDGTTVLGADNKAGLAAILEALAVLQEGRIVHRGVEVLCTVAEETGLLGSKAFDTSRLRSKMGLGLDATGDPGAIVTSAPSQDSLHAHVHGRAAHAGGQPEAGISAIVVAARAISQMPLGRIDAETTANIGTISGGSATNIVPDSCTLRGEARSRDRDKLERQTAAMVAALKESARAQGATVDVEVRRVYHGYTWAEDHPLIRLAADAVRAAGLEPYLVPSGGGSDANILNAAGLPTVQLAAGMQDVHTCNEHIALEDLVRVTRIVLASLTI